MEKDFLKDERITIILFDNRELTANFVRALQRGIEVTNVTDVITGKTRHYRQTFYASEIKSVDRVDRSSSGTSSTKSSVIENPDFNNNNAVIEKKTFLPHEIENIQQFARSTVYITQFDSKYHNALKDLQQQEIIGVHSENPCGRLHVQGPLLSLTAYNRVYLFDMLRLGPMKKEFKDIFERKVPRKAVHCSAQLVDYLEHKENCKLNNSFDTLMVHFSLTKTREVIPLQKCFSKYFILPDDFVLQKFDYEMRPIVQEALIRAALNGLLLMKLYWHMNDLLVKPLRAATNVFSQIYMNVNHPVDLMTHMHNGQYPGVEKVSIKTVDQVSDAFSSLRAQENSTVQ